MAQFREETIGNQRPFVIRLRAEAETVSEVRK